MARPRSSTSQELLHAISKVSLSVNEVKAQVAQVATTVSDLQEKIERVVKQPEGEVDNDPIQEK